MGKEKGRELHPPSTSVCSPNLEGLRVPWLGFKKKKKKNYLLILERARGGGGAEGEGGNPQADSLLTEELRAWDHDLS